MKTTRFSIGRESTRVYFNMSQGNRYQIPADSVTIEQELKRSRFIASVARAPDKSRAEAFIRTVRSTHPGANHHCWAYVAGNPFDAPQMGMSDDGEPQGTAGKPMLNILQHSQIGEIVAVVTRYFGGIKLGTGGLVRAYSSSVQLALQNLPLTEYVALTSARISLPYPYEDRVRRLLKKRKIGITEVKYEDKVGLSIEFPQDLARELEEQIGDQTMGQAKLSITRIGDQSSEDV